MASLGAAIALVQVLSDVGPRRALFAPVALFLGTGGRGPFLEDLRAG